MSKNTLNLKPKQAITLFLAFLLVLSCFADGVRFAGGETTIFSTQTDGSATAIAALENSIEDNGGWNSSLQTIYDGIALGQTTVNQLQNAVDSISISSASAAESVFYWYFQLSKFGVSINATTIEAALNEATMLPSVGGLPHDYSNSGTASFEVYNRYDLYAYQWAAQLGYETSKWNLTQAYTVFDNAINESGKPILWVGCNGKGSGIGYGPRYYDEGAETIDMYLTFWLLGIPGGLTQAEYWWNWENLHLWDANDSGDGGFYKYAINWTAFECEAGGLDQIIWKLYNYDPSIQNVTNLFTDMETRALSQGWSSPQWADNVAVHASGVNGSAINSQERLENTIMSWAAILGLYGNMTGTMQSQVQALLDGSAGSAPAWNLTLQSKLYDNDTDLFKGISDASDSVEDTADGAALLMLLSTVPVTGSLAVPLQDCTYQDINGVIDGGVSSIDLASRTVIVSVAKPGTFLSLFGTDIFEYNISTAGVWQLTFGNNWNSITSQTFVSTLPSSRIYIGVVGSTPLSASTPTISAISDPPVYNAEFPSIAIALMILLAVSATISVFIKKRTNR